MRKKPDIVEVLHPAVDDTKLRHRLELLGNNGFTAVTVDIWRRHLQDDRIRQLLGSRNDDVTEANVRLHADTSRAQIPARVQDISSEDLLLMSLVENLARRQARSAELLEEIAALKKRGYKTSQIAAKTDLTPAYVSEVLRLSTHGEENLLQAVEKRRIPLGVAIMIATSDDEGVQRALHEAYDQNLLRGKELLRVRAFIERRRVGQAIKANQAKDGEPDPSSLSTRKMLRAYRDETARQRIVVTQAQLCQRQLLYAVAALKRLFTDENFVNQLQPIQEHFMVLRAIKNGVSEERIARTLNVNLDTIKQKRDLRIGICPEAAELLRDRKASAGAIREIKRVKPMRQIEMAEIMVVSDNYTSAYAKCLVLASAPDQLLEPNQPTASGAMEEHDVARLQREISGMEHGFRLVQEEYGRNMLSLVVVIGYLRSLLDRAAVVHYLSRAEPTMLAEFQRIIDHTDMKAVG